MKKISQHEKACFQYSGYQAPGIVYNNDEYDDKSEMFTVGVIFWELLFGKCPFGGYDFFGKVIANSWDEYSKKSEFYNCEVKRALKELPMHLKEIEGISTECKELMVSLLSWDRSDRITVKEAKKLIKNKKISDYFEKCIEIDIDSKDASNWINENIVSYINKNNIEIDEIYLTPEMLKFILNNIKEGVISSKQAKDVFNKVLDEKINPKKLISKENAQISDINELKKIIDEIISANPNQVSQYKNGKDRLFDFFVGQVMKNTRGKANPIITKEVLHKKLD